MVSLSGNSSMGVFEIWEIFESTYFDEYLPTTASDSLDSF